MTVWNCIFTGGLLWYWLSYPRKLSIMEALALLVFSLLCPQGMAQIRHRMQAMQTEWTNGWRGESKGPSTNPRLWWCEVKSRLNNLFSIPAYFSYFHSFREKEAAGMEAGECPGRDNPEVLWMCRHGLRQGRSAHRIPLIWAALRITELLLFGKTRGQLSLLHPQMM